MCEFWNSKLLKLPPVFTYKTDRTDIDVPHLYDVLEQGVKFYRNTRYLNAEAALLSRCIYRSKLRFRNSKDLKLMQIINNSLLKYLQLEIADVLVQFGEVLPNSFSPNGTYFPTKSLLDYVLVRLQGLGQLMKRIVGLCLATAEVLEMKLQIGHTWNIHMIFVAMISRIYVLSRQIIEYTCTLYLRLFPFTHKLENLNNNWLPVGYVLPKDLKEWLNIDWSQYDEVIEIPDTFESIPLFDLLEDSDDEVEYCGQYIEVNDRDFDKNLVKKKFGENSLELRGFKTEETDDIGEIIFPELCILKNEDLSVQILDTLNTSAIKSEKDLNEKYVFNTSKSIEVLSSDEEQPGFQYEPKNYNKKKKKQISVTINLDTLDKGVKQKKNVTIDITPIKTLKKDNIKTIVEKSQLASSSSHPSVIDLITPKNIKSTPGKKEKIKSDADLQSTPKRKKQLASSSSNLSVVDLITPNNFKSTSSKNKRKSDTSLESPQQTKKPKYGDYTFLLLETSKPSKKALQYLESQTNKKSIRNRKRRIKRGINYKPIPEPSIFPMTTRLGEKIKRNSDGNIVPKKDSRPQNNDYSLSRPKKLNKNKILKNRPGVNSKKNKRKRKKQNLQ